MVEGGQLGNADMREVVGTQAQETPTGYVHRCQRELVCQISVLVFQSQIVFIAIVIRQNSCLPEEEGFYLEEVVPMLVYGTERNILGPCLESIAIQTEAEVTCQCDEKSACVRLTARTLCGC